MGIPKRHRVNPARDPCSPWEITPRMFATYRIRAKPWQSTPNHRSVAFTQPANRASRVSVIEIIWNEERPKFCGMRRYIPRATRKTVTTSWQ